MLPVNYRCQQQVNQTYSVINMASNLKNVLILFIAIPSFSHVILAAKILVHPTNPLSQASHNIFLNAITTGLQARSHRVTILTTDIFKPRGFTPEGYSERVTFKTTTPESEIQQLMKSTASFADGDFLSQIHMLKKFTDVPYQNCEDMLNDADTMENLKQEKFDLLLLEVFMPCEVILAEYLDVPFVVVTPSTRFYFFNEDVYGMHTPASYVPLDPLSSYTDDMTFIQRLNNCAYRYLVNPLMFHFVAESYNKLRATYKHDIQTSVRELMGQAEIWLCQIDFALDYPRPTAPNWIPIGGILASDSKPLPKDLEDFVQGSGEHGIIVFSLGSLGTSALMNDEMRELFAQVFSDLPQRVLWCYSGTPLRNLGNNTRIMEWLPQNDLLGHPKTRLLIYHGGVNGVYEALYHKVPMVLIPLFADQPSIAARISKKGFGLVLDKQTVTYENLKEAITEVLYNSSFKDNVEKYSSIHRDTIASPLDTAVFWIEHVLKFGGGHLKSRANELNFFVLNSFDVIAFLLALSLIILYIDFIILRTCYRCTCGKKSLKAKSD